MDDYEADILRERAKEQNLAVEENAYALERSEERVIALEKQVAVNVERIQDFQTVITAMMDSRR